MKMLLNSVEGSRSEVKRRPHKQLHINPVYRRSWPMDAFPGRYHCGAVHVYTVVAI